MILLALNSPALNFENSCTTYPTALRREQITLSLRQFTSPALHSKENSSIRYIHFYIPFYLPNSTEGKTFHRHPCVATYKPVLLLLFNFAYGLVAGTGNSTNPSIESSALKQEQRRRRHPDYLPPLRPPDTSKRYFIYYLPPSNRRSRTNAKYVTATMQIQITRVIIH